MPSYGRPRRITKLQVDEISLVDRPANREPFLLYKRDKTLADAERAEKAASGACECGVNCPEDCDCGDPMCPHAGRGEGGDKAPAGTKSAPPMASHKCETPRFLASFVDGAGASDAGVRGLVKYDTSAVRGALDRIAEMAKDSQAAVSTDGPGGRPAAGETSKDANGWLEVLGGKVASDPPDQGAGGGTKGASQASIDPDKAEGFSGGMGGPVGPKVKGQAGGIATDPPNQDAGGSPKGASQAAI